MKNFYHFKLLIMIIWFLLIKKINFEVSILIQFCILFSKI